MRRSIFRLLAIVAVVGLAASCGGGGGDSRYNFGGRWAFLAIVTESNVPANPIGSQYVDVLLVDQNGNNLSVTFLSVGPELVMVGPCDPKGRTFTVNGVGTGSIFGSSAMLSGAGIDADSMSGTFRLTFPGGRFTAGTWTADLSFRAIGGGAGDGGVKNLIRRALQ